MPGPASGAAAGRLRLAVRAAATPAGRRLLRTHRRAAGAALPARAADALLRHRPLRAGPGQGQAGRQLPHRARHPAVRGHHRRRQPAFPHQRRRHPVAAAARRRQPADRGRSPGRQRPGPGTRRPGAAAGKAGAGAAGRAAAEQPAHPLGRLAAQRRRALRPAVRPQPANQLPVAGAPRPGALHPPRRAAARLRLRRRRSAAAGRGRRASGARAAGGILRLPGKVRLLRPAAQPAAPSGAAVGNRHRLRTRAGRPPGHPARRHRAGLRAGDQSVSAHLRSRCARTATAANTCWWPTPTATTAWKSTPSASCAPPAGRRAPHRPFACSHGEGGDGRYWHARACAASTGCAPAATCC